MYYSFYYTWLWIKNRGKNDVEMFAKSDLSLNLEIFVFIDLSGE